MKNLAFVFLKCTEFFFGRQLYLAIADLIGICAIKWELFKENLLQMDSSQAVFANESRMKKLTVNMMHVKMLGNFYILLLFIPNKGSIWTTDMGSSQSRFWPTFEFFNDQKTSGADRFGEPKNPSSEL